MATLHIHLQQGFDQDTVVVTVNGQEIYREEGITENLMRALSDDTLQTQVPMGEVEVQVEVITRDITATESFPMTADPMYFGISIVNGEIQFFGPLEQTFFYG